MKLTHFLNGCWKYEMSHIYDNKSKKYSDQSEAKQFNRWPTNFYILWYLMGFEVLEFCEALNSLSITGSLEASDWTEILKLFVIRCATWSGHANIVQCCVSGFILLLFLFCVSANEVYGLYIVRPVRLYLGPVSVQLVFF